MHALWRRDTASVELKVFLAFELLGGIGNIAMLITAIVSSRVNRHLTWINFCITWVIYALSYTLLLFAGQQTNSAGPAYPLCLTQASLIYGAPVLTACSSAALVAQVWLSLNAAIYDQKSTTNALSTLLLIAAPYIVWFGVVLGAIIVGTKNPGIVRRAHSDVYCVIETGVPGHVSSVLVVIILVAAIVVQGMIVRTVYKDWRVQRERRYPNQVSLSMIIRIGCFILMSIATICQVIVFVSNNFAIANIYISLMPIIAFFIFATQKDIMRVWTFRRMSLF